MYPDDERFNCTAGAKGLYIWTRYYVYLIEWKLINELPKYQKQATWNKVPGASYMEQWLKEAINKTAKAHSNVENPLPCPSSAPDVQVSANHEDAADPNVFLM